MTAFGLIFVGDGLSATQGAARASWSVNISMTLLPGIVCFIGLIIWVLYYPLTGKVVETMKKEVRILHEQKRNEYRESRSS